MLSEGHRKAKRQRTKIMSICFVMISCLMSILMALSSCSTSGLQANGISANKKQPEQAGQSHDSDALIKVIRANDAEALKRLLSAGADPNEKGSDRYTPLMMAVL